jgi:hypothetical protein
MPLNQHHSHMVQSRTATRSSWQLVCVAVAGGIIGVAMIAVNLYTAARLEGHIRPSTPYADVFSKLDDPVDILFALGDGQGFVALARDPTLANLKAFRGSRDEASLRASRPLQGYLGWVFSVGRPQWAEEGVMVATVVGCSIAALGCALLLRRRRQSPWLALIVLELPGALAAIRQLGPELLGLGLVALALVARDEDRPWESVCLFALAGLARETYLLIPLVLAIRERRYLLPHIVWLGWTGVVWLRFGAWPPTIHLSGTRLLVFPFTGLARALPRLQFWPMTITLMILVPVLLIAVIQRRRQDPLTRFVAAYGVLSLFLNPVIWAWWASFSRVLLPMTAFGSIALLAPQMSEQTSEISRG